MSLSSRWWLCSVTTDTSTNLGSHSGNPCAPLVSAAATVIAAQFSVLHCTEGTVNIHVTPFFYIILPFPPWFSWLIWTFHCSKHNCLQQYLVLCAHMSEQVQFPFNHSDKYQLSLLYFNISYSLCTVDPEHFSIAFHFKGPL